MKMPHRNISQLKDYEHFILQESAKNKLKFLMKTLLNSKQIKKTLDLKKMARIRKSKELKAIGQQIEQSLRQKIDIRRIKLRVKNQLIKSNNLRRSENQHRCPVYLCKHSARTEEELIAHYNSSHKDLIELGLLLLPGREAREKRKTRINLNKEAGQKSDSSYSEMSEGDQVDILSDAKYDSDLEDLIRLESIEVNQLQSLTRDSENEDIDVLIHNQAILSTGLGHGVSRLQAIQKLIKQKK